VGREARLHDFLRSWQHWPARRRRVASPGVRRRRHPTG